MKTYKLKVTYSFTGTYTIEAESKKEAIRIAGEDCGCANPIYSTINLDQVKDWEFPIHANNKIVKL